MGQHKDRRLVFSGEDGNEAAYPVGQPSTSIGRSADNLVRLEDRQVSKHHAAIRCTDDGCHIEDLGSHNGVYLNGKRVTVAPVEHGDKIGIGPYRFTFQAVEPGTPFPSPRNGKPKPKRKASLLGLIANRRAQDTITRR